jgi:hypothetical protein
MVEWITRIVIPRTLGIFLCKGEFAFGGKFLMTWHLRNLIDEERC